MEEKKATNPPKKKFNYIVKFWLIYFTGVLLVVLLFYAIANQYFGTMPSFKQLENPESALASEVISSDGKILGTYFIENRSNVTYRQLPPYLVNALISIEDVRFEQNSGIDERALGRVAYGLLTGQHKGGGSTITQQLAKNLFPRGDLNKLQLIVRKFQEWITSVKLERYYSKEEIITMYLNTVFYGHNAYGIKSAARTFFDKEPDSLNLQESALMAGVVNRPTAFSPILHPRAAMERRNLVLSQMYRYGYITKHVYDSVKFLPLGVEKYGLLSHNTGDARYFREFLREKMTDWCKTHFKTNGQPYNLYTDGLKIYTTIDSRMQRYAEEAVKEHLAEDLQPAFFAHWKGYPNAPFDFQGTPKEDSLQVEKILDNAMRRSERYRLMRLDGIPLDSIVMAFNTPVSMRVFSWNGGIDTVMTPMDSIRYYKSFLLAGLMSMESSTGYVRAYVGGIDFKYFKYDHVTQAKRQVGSTFKPFLYTLAMQEGEYSPCFRIPNIPYSVPLPDGKYWTPDNADSKDVGKEVTLKWALANSNNWISAWLIRRFSPQSVIQMARNMGVTSFIPPVPAIALGTPDISLYEMTGAMNTFADKGVYIKPVFITKIEDKNGNVLERFAPEKKEAMSEVTAYKMIKLLEGVVESGTGVRLRWKYGFRNEVAGKTGTTQNQSDGWFMGMVPKLTTGVWVGAEDRSVHFRTITLGQGANMALPIWALYMEKIYSDPSLGISKSDDFPKPLKNIDIQFDCNKYNKEHKKNSFVNDSIDHF
ncbi:MAG: transglycosylase domain-containing protein [Bacteroidales bacterium]|nr:transglycosylase domain-containing protein [Bacteroidales bacterium]